MPYCHTGAAEGKIAVVHLVGKAPEQQGHHHRAPELCHDVEEAETPVAEDCDGGGCLAAQLGQQAFTEGCTQQAVSRCLVSCTQSGSLLRWCVPVGWMMSLRGYMTKAKDPKNAMKGRMQA